jgi:hypothetical protein
MKTLIAKTASLAAVAVSLAAAALPTSAAAMASHDGWPPMHMLLMNKDDSSRPLDARPGFDPFGGLDAGYSCDSLHKMSSSCAGRFVRNADRTGFVITERRGHSRLLGGHGDDTLHASPWGDVLWGDYKPTGNDVIHGHFGHGRIDCGPGRDVVYVHGAHRHRYNLKGCEVVSTKTGESAPKWFIRKLPW